MRRGQLAVLVVFVALCVLGCQSDGPVAPASDPPGAMLGAGNGKGAGQGPGTQFIAPLSGDQEVHDVDTQAKGIAKFQLQGDGLHYRLIVSGLSDVTASHIHMAPAGLNGGVVAFLFSGPALGPVNGVLAEGVITADDLVGGLAGHSLDELVAAIAAGNSYVNVHTLAYPPGEIRGQIAAPGIQN